MQPQSKRYFTFLGPIAAGKGTQSERISKIYGFYHLSTGAMFRNEIERGTPLGLEVKDILARGDLVPDETTNNLVWKILNEIDLSKGFILDGYPRNLEQAKSLDEMLRQFSIAIDMAINIEVSEERIIARLSGRFTCAKCFHNYHDVDMRPTVEGKCNACGSHEFVRRDDDKPEVIKNRLKVYHANVAPIKRYYREQGKLFEIDGNENEADMITERIRTIIEIDNASTAPRVRALRTRHS
ncbi:MAG: adenylate kinase [Alphaproteobacteria bacterium]|nr:adenylate kinase [Alphaproteobacteria bacterium]